MSDILKQITEYKKSEVLKLKKKQSIKDFEKEIINAVPKTGIRVIKDGCLIVSSKKIME